MRRMRISRKYQRRFQVIRQAFGGVIFNTKRQIVASPTDWPVYPGGNRFRALSAATFICASNNLPIGVS